MTRHIYEAIKILPGHLLTQDIVDAAVGEGRIELLDCLPKKFMTSSIVNSIVEKNADSYGNFKLENIPEEYRTQEVCECAVAKNVHNIRHVPVSRRTNTMLQHLVGYSLKSNLHLLPLIPAGCWDGEAAYKGVCTLSKGEGSYNRGRYHTSSYIDYKPVQMLLSYVPKKIKNGKFYRSLSGISSLSVKDLEFLIPNRHKQGDYYLLVARKDFSCVPAGKYSYAIFMEAMSEQGGTSFWKLQQDKEICGKLYEVMDDAMAGHIISRWPKVFSDLPDQFRTEERLLKAIETNNDHAYGGFIDTDKDAGLLTSKVCKALVKKDKGYGKIPARVWTQDFVDFCVRECPSYSWFGQMPKQFQTQDIVNAAIDTSIYKIEHADSRYITEEIAMKAYRQFDRNELKDTFHKYVPSAYLDDFVQATGLPKEFFGGEAGSYGDFREKRENYSYCRLGHVYIGYFIERINYSLSYHRIIMTRRSPESIRPGIVFNRAAGACHKTWLEKMIADYDPAFNKPVLQKGLKKYQLNPYFDVRRGQDVEGHKIFTNTLFGAGVSYATEFGGEVCHRKSVEKLKEEINGLTEATV
jgi:hypothetical protein